MSLSWMIFLRFCTSQNVLLKYAFCAAFATAGAGLASAAELSLNRAVVIASERDATVTSMRQRVASRSIDVEAARDAYYPSFSLSGESSSTASDGPAITLTVSQILFDWGLIRNEIMAATQVRTQAVADLKMAVEDLTLQVAFYFLDIETIGLKIARTRNYLSFAERIAGHARNRAQGGLGDRAEVARANLEIARARDELSQLTANREMAIAQLAFLIDQNPGVPKAPPEIGFDRVYNNAARLRTAVRIAPEYIAARAFMDETTADIGVAKAKRFPTINLEAQARGSLDGGDTRTAVGISAGVDLSSRGLGKRQMQAAILENEAAKSSLLAVERDMTNAAQNALSQLRTLRATEAARKGQLVESQRVLDTYEEQFIGGQRELIDLLTTGRDLYDARIDVIDTYDERKRTEYQNARDLGVLGTLILSVSG
ncbi:TolC family protein [Epibacterium sp. Ofav1-8]|uniref:TolC family protein n=1 Tax=Epibacterium sp. Ofav1-8 TaxID=2917735 RepID=UPI001EF48365|nr:TolC family protein [Epibacterium sp. Ofav1-8]